MRGQTSLKKRVGLRGFCELELNRQIPRCLAMERWEAELHGELMPLDGVE